MNWNPLFPPDKMAQQLLEWWRENRIEYPWRGAENSYLVWISEIMLQQTVAAAVIPYFERWREDFPTLKALAEAEDEQVLRRWEGLGYYSRVRNIHKTARLLQAEKKSELPADYETLRSLPGIGDYTARAILSIAYGLPWPVIDANVKRIGQRLFNQPEINRSFIEKLEQYLGRAIPRETPGDFNEALMQLGQQVCRSKRPDCQACPLRWGCLAAEAGTAASIPEGKKKAVTILNTTRCAFLTDSEILLFQNRRGRLKELWRFPRLAGPETEALPGNKIAVIHLTHSYTSYREHITLLFRAISDPAGVTPDLFDGEDFHHSSWHKISGLKELTLPSPYRKALNTFTADYLSTEQ